MRTMTATQASRGFSAMLDLVEHDKEEIYIERDGRPVAKIEPVPLFSGAGLRRALEGFEGSGNDSLERELDQMRTLLTWDDPWAE
jgi:PHD/YefM family antitoxin component YafN of YafNO toxin-antitoxin module